MDTLFLGPQLSLQVMHTIPSCFRFSCPNLLKTSFYVKIVMIKNCVDGREQMFHVGKDYCMLDLSKAISVKEN